MYTVAIVTMKSKLAFAVLNIPFIDHSKLSNVSFQTQNTNEKCRYVPYNNKKQIMR